MTLVRPKAKASNKHNTMPFFISLLPSLPREIGSDVFGEATRYSFSKTQLTAPMW